MSKQMQQLIVEMKRTINYKTKYVCLGCMPQLSVGVMKVVAKGG
jgi:hypothetical protein